MMNRKVILFFLAAMIVSAVALNWLFQRRLKLREDNHLQKVQVLHDSVMEKFQLTMDAPLSVGAITAKYLTNNKIDQNAYHKLAASILSEHPEIIGINLVDPDGRIFLVHPEDRNSYALGRITQNISFLKASFAKDEKFWLSPPFELFQTELGFAFYIPMIKNNRLIGWAAPVMSYQKFFEKFKISRYLNKYHLVIEDIESKKNFFSSSPLPQNTNLLIKNEGLLFGRKINFFSWQITPSITYKPNKWITLLISFIISAFATYAFRMKSLRRKERSQLTKINALLDSTAHEASSALNIFQRQLKASDNDNWVEREKVANYIFYVCNLLDQLSITSKLCQSSYDPQVKPVGVLELLQEQIALFQNINQEKAIIIKVDHSDFANFKVSANRWLLSHSVFGNILRTLIIKAPEHTEIQISVFKDGDFHIISFHCTIDEKKTSGQHDEIIDRGLEIAS